MSEKEIREKDVAKHAKGQDVWLLQTEKKEKKNQKLEFVLQVSPGGSINPFFRHVIAPVTSI